jgi:hypothetical protein
MAASTPRPGCWLRTSAVALTLVFLADSRVLAQRGQPAPRPAPAGGPQFRPAPQPRPLQPQNQPGRPFVPGAQPARNEQIVLITVWKCSQCQTELGRGPNRPALAKCPHCGCLFTNNPMTADAVAQRAGAEWETGIPSTAMTTLGIEGAFFGGLVLVGAVRLAIDRSRGRQGEAPAAV